jgi:membrane protease YdiL (CAAX protease family)
MNSKARPATWQYFALVYALSLPWWVASFMLRNTSLPLDIPITDVVAAFMPVLAAVILTYRQGGKSGVRRLLARGFDYKKVFGTPWLVVAIGIPVVLFAAIYIVLLAIGADVPAGWSFAWWSLPLLVGFFWAGAYAEEVGYMGYAADQLQRRWSGVITGLLIGIPWAVWHIPSMLVQGRSWGWIAWGVAGTVAFRVIDVWLYNNAARSVFVCIVIHTIYNSGRVIFPSDTTHAPLVHYPVVHYGVIIVMTVLIVLLWGRRTTNFLKNRQTERG